MSFPKKHMFFASLVVGALFSGGCARLPDLPQNTTSAVEFDTSATRLGLAIEPAVQKRPGLSGVYLLSKGRDAFAARMLLLGAAEQTVDIQYYIWRNDISGNLLFDEVLRAAKRGVRVRLLLDDNNTSGLDPILTRLNAHQNIEVRLFNPFVHRGSRVLGFLTDFARLNRRMHNKSFTVDGQVSIVGGRNVGDEYFGASLDFMFMDADLMAVGPVAADVSSDFERYWESASSYPLESLVANAIEESPVGEALHAVGGLTTANYSQAVEESPFVANMLAGKLPFDWAPAYLISDEPAKALGHVEEASLFSRRLRKHFGAPQSELRLVSPYFVPTESGLAYLLGLAEQGVEVTVLTNSLEATDVAAVHAGYVKHRKALLEGGVRIFELRQTGAGSINLFKGSGLSGISASSLHAKVFIVDRKTVFVGSYNFDPRSALLNTEMGFVVESPALASRMASTMAERLQPRAYEVRLRKDGELEWVEQVDGKEVAHESEPGTTFWRRLGIGILTRLPIDSLL